MDAQLLNVAIFPIDLTQTLPGFSIWISDAISVRIKHTNIVSQPRNVISADNLVMVLNPISCGLADFCILICYPSAQ